MPRTKSLLKRCTIETAQIKRKCKNTGKSIAGGCRCIVVFDGPRQRFCYSKEIALLMIETARKDLNELQRELGA